jgi:hypothetical protein
VQAHDLLDVHRLNRIICHLVLFKNEIKPFTHPSKVARFKPKRGPDVSKSIRPKVASLEPKQSPVQPLSPNPATGTV